jgi:hypothetical protein
MQIKSIGIDLGKTTFHLAHNVGSSFLVKGKYIEFTVDPATFGVRGARNPDPSNLRLRSYLCQ